MKRVAGAVLAGLGAIMLAFCAWFAVFDLIPAYEKMIRTGDGAGFGLGLLMVLWWFVPALAALVVGGCSAVRRVPSRPFRAVFWRWWPGLAAALALGGHCPGFRFAVGDVRVVCVADDCRGAYGAPALARSGTAPRLGRRTAVARRVGLRRLVRYVKEGKP